MSSSIAEAVRLLQAGRLADAEAVARAALAQRRDAGALHVLGCIRAQAGARDEGLALLDEAIALDPRDASFLNNRARILAEAGRLDEAARDLREALAIMPGFDAARAQLVQVLSRQGACEIARARHREAEALFRAAVALAPGDAGAHNNLGVSLQRQGRAAEAIEEFRRALAADPALADAHVNWGNAIENTGDLDAARAHYLRAVELAPRSPDAWLNAASNAVELGRLDEARRHYGRAIELRADSSEARYGLAILDLREQRFGAGWRGFERRFDTVPPQSTRRGPPLPAFVPVAGERPRVAVWREQGIGDQVLFSTLIPELAADARPVVEVDARLLGAYRRSVADVEFVAGDTARAFASCRSQLGIASLALLYRPDRASFARQPARLLRADAARVKSMRDELGEGRFIAIAWRSAQGGLRAGLAARKSIPLELFARLARARGARLVDVQYGDAVEERAAFDAAHPGMRIALRDLDAFNDLEGVLAAIEACGEVVTSSNVTAHLAGASGIPCTVVMPGARSPFHYWDAADGPRSLWYPSVTIARDPAWTRWEDAFDALSGS